MDISTILFCVILYFLIRLCLFVLTTNFRSRSSLKTPPGPYRFPVIGNLHLVGKNPHQTFAKLSKRYGPLMSLKLGSREVVIVSNAAMAREVLQKNDLVCSSRSVPAAAQVHDHHNLSMLWIPVSSTWRYMRKFCKEQMFASHRLDANEDLRQEKIQDLIQHVEKCSENGVAMDIGAAAFITSLNLMTRTLFSIDHANYDSNSSHELQEVLGGIMESLGAPSVSDLIPALRWVDLQRFKRSRTFYFGRLMDIFDGIIKKRVLVREASGTSSNQQPKKSDFLESLLDENSKNESQLSFNVLKHLLLDLFVAGIDTTSNTVEWAMSELLRNPRMMEKAREELKQVIGEKSMRIQESDISRLPYLQAIVKETFRFHPVGPLLLPHKAIEDVKIGGYIVPKDTEIMFNVWASGRDEETWTQPEMFMPERFLKSEIDVKGNHFELIPFGAGRRMCPGIPLAHRMMHLMLATFIHKFDWKLEGGLKPEDLNMEEKFGLTIQRADPLKAIPVKL